MKGTIKKYAKEQQRHISYFLEEVNDKEPKNFLEVLYKRYKNRFKAGSFIEEFKAIAPPPDDWQLKLCKSLCKMVGEEADDCAQTRKKQLEKSDIKWSKFLEKIDATYAQYVSSQASNSSTSSRGSRSATGDYEGGTVEGDDATSFGGYADKIRKRKTKIVVQQRAGNEWKQRTTYYEPLMSESLVGKIGDVLFTVPKDHTKTYYECIDEDGNIIGDASLEKCEVRFPIPQKQSTASNKKYKNKNILNSFEKTANYGALNVLSHNGEGNSMIKNADKVSKKYYQDAISGLEDQYAKSYYAGLKSMYDKKPKKTKADYSKLYELHDESGPELIGSAHPKTIDIAEAMGNGGIFENQIEQQRHNIGVAQSMPSGNFQGKHAWIIQNLVKLANYADKVGDRKSSDFIDSAIEELKKL